MTNRAWPLLVVAVILAVFFPAFTAEICKVDDAQMVESIQRTTHWSLGNLFLPGAKGGLYYRPLSYLPFLINQSIFGLNAFSLHTENILLHLANTLLVFFIIQQLLILEESGTSSKTAFVGSLLFGLHPLVTESVNWISGRTDLFMGFFLLISVYLLLRYRITGKKYYPWIAAFSFLCALLSKELAIAFLPGFFLILYAKRQADIASSPTSIKAKFFVILGVTLLVVGTFFLLRTVAFDSNSSRIGLTLQYIQINPVHSFFLFLRAIGFYLKKLFLPWPLNFAIVEVDPLYELAAIPLIGISFYIAFRGTLLTAIFSAGLLLFTPALLIGLNQIAWTPYAERYLYCTTAFTSIAFVVYCHRHFSSYAKTWHYGITTTFLAILAVMTFQRNCIWQTNRQILADTAEKAPAFQRIQWLYGAELMKEGDYQKAFFYTKRAANLPGSPLFYEQIPEINLGHIYYQMGDIAESIATYEAVIRKTLDKSPEAYEGLITCYLSLLEKSSDKEEKIKYFQSIQAHAERLFAMRPDPLIYYKLGKIALADKQPTEARKYFTLAASHMPENHELYPIVHKLLQH